MRISFLQRFNSRKEYKYFFKIIVLVCLFVGSNHCLFEEVIALWASFVSTSENIVCHFKEVGSNNPHQHQETNSNDSHSHGEPHLVFLFGLGQGIFLFLKKLGLVLISSLILAISYTLVVRKYYFKRNKSNLFDLFQWDLYSLNQVLSKVSPRAPPILA